MVKDKDFSEMSSSASTLCLSSLITKFEGGLLGLGLGGFRLRDAISRKLCEKELRLQLITNRKSYIGFRL